MGKFKETKFFKWIDNFWYHHKFGIFIVSVLVVFLTVSTAQCMRRTEYDVYITYAGPKAVSAEHSNYIEQAFEKISRDYNGDGKVEACLSEYTILSSEEIKGSTEPAKNEDAENEGLIMNEQIVGSQMMGAQKAFNQEIFGGDSVILLLSPYVYSTLPVEDGVSHAFLTLEEVLGYTPEGAYDNCAIYLNTLDFGKQAGLASLPEDTLLCVRRLSSMSFLKGEDKTKKAHEYHLGIFRAIFDYKSELN